MIIIFTDKEQIRYLDVDKNNKLTNKAIINIMQDVAGSHSELLHNGLNDKEKTGTAWILLNWKVEVFFRPKYKDILTVNTWARKLEKCFSYRDFEMYAEEKLVAKAESKWVLVDAKTNRLTMIPLDVIDKYKPEERLVFKEKIEEKLQEPQNAQKTYEEIVSRTKIDTNNHLNNIYYLDLAIESLPEEVYEKEESNNLEIMYKKASKYKEKLECYYGKEDEKHVVVIKDQENNIHAIVKMW